MKKLICTLLTLTLICTFALAETAYVTISDSDGNLCLACAATEVTDSDGDGALTISDALYCAHEQYFEGGAAAGYVAESTDYGLSLTKLWGIDNGGAFGYYLNDASCLSLADPISDGARVQAYAYRDLETWSDTFSYFRSNDDGSLTLIMQGHDADWNVVETPVVGAQITIDGADAGIVTDENGTFAVPDEQISKPGDHVISATYDGAVLVPPVFVISTAVE